MTPKELQELIKQEFDGVTREGGVSWQKSHEIDCGKVGLQHANWDDEDSTWMEVAEDERWEPDRGVGGWNFLDPIGMRYYLPAGMVRSLESGRDVGLLYQLCFGLGFSVARPELDRSWRPKRLSLLTDSQMRAVGLYVAMMSLYEKQEPKNFLSWFLKTQTWKRAMDNYWKIWL